jgi:hypothetical protein
MNEAFNFQSNQGGPSPAAPEAVAPSNEFTLTGKTSKPKKGKVKLFFNLPGPGLLSASQKRATARAIVAKGGALVKPISVNAEKAGPVTITITPTRAGRAILGRRGKLKLLVEVTFTPTGGSPSSQIVKVSLRLK